MIKPFTEYDKITVQFPEFQSKQAIIEKSMNSQSTVSFNLSVKCSISFFY